MLTLTKLSRGKDTGSAERDAELLNYEQLLPFVVSELCSYVFA
jgi:hypothetical protein